MVFFLLFKMFPFDIEQGVIGCHTLKRVSQRCSIIDPYVLAMNRLLMGSFGLGNPLLIPVAKLPIQLHLV